MLSAYSRKVGVYFHFVLKTNNLITLLLIISVSPSTVILYRLKIVRKSKY